MIDNTRPCTSAKSIAFEVVLLVFSAPEGCRERELVVAGQPRMLSRTTTPLSQRRYWEATLGYILKWQVLQGAAISTTLLEFRVGKPMHQERYPSVDFPNWLDGKNLWRFDGLGHVWKSNLLGTSEAGPGKSQWDNNAEVCRVTSLGCHPWRRTALGLGLWGENWGWKTGFNHQLKYIDIYIYIHIYIYITMTEILPWVFPLQVQQDLCFFRITSCWMTSRIFMVDWSLKLTGVRARHDTHWDHGLRRQAGEVGLGWSQIIPRFLDHKIGKVVH